METSWESQVHFGNRLSAHIWAAKFALHSQRLGHWPSWDWVHCTLITQPLLCSRSCQRWSSVQASFAPNLGCEVGKTRFLSARTWPRKGLLAFADSKIFSCPSNRVVRLETIHRNRILLSHQRRRLRSSGLGSRCDLSRRGGTTCKNHASHSCAGDEHTRTNSL